MDSCKRRRTLHLKRFYLGNTGTRYCDGENPNTCYSTAIYLYEHTIARLIKSINAGNRFGIYSIKKIKDIFIKLLLINNNYIIN